MARHYQLEVARWEGEGGAPAEGVVSSIQDPPMHRTVALWPIVFSIGILTGSLLYARRKGWL
jgi:hypothetical protein